MIADHRKSLAAFVFVACVSAPSLGSSPPIAALKPDPVACAEFSGLAALESSGSAISFAELALASAATGSYGWSGGLLVHRDRALCLAKDREISDNVVFRACDSADPMQIWQWKNYSLAHVGASASVLQHQASGQVLARVRVDVATERLALGGYQVGSDAQRFSIGMCGV
jgi:hypothetical protein